MTWASICNAWYTELTNSVPELADAIPHLYAPWSVERLVAELDERHIAIWPEAEPDAMQNLTTGPLGPVQMANENFVIAVWEDARVESIRRIDDEQANLAWLALHEAIRARLTSSANNQLGDTQISSTRYQGCAFGIEAMCRTLAVRFQVKIPLSYT
jgi:hypothetical protein